MADQYATLQGMDVEVYSVSTDTHFSHKAWHDSSPAIGKIDFPMLGDQNHDLTKNFNVLREGVGLADRGTFVVDPDGIIQITEVTCEGVGRNASELRPQDQGGAVCPRPPRPGLPGQVGRRRGDAGPVAGPRRQDLTHKRGPAAIARGHPGGPGSNPDPTQPCFRGRNLLQGQSPCSMRP